MKEVKGHRYAGPFVKPPMDNFIQSPIGLVPKAGGKTRLIFHLSYDFGDEIHQKSVNFHTPPELCKVRYNDLDHAVRLSIQILKHFGKSQLFYAKSDFSGAFRILPIKVSHRFCLILKARHPVTQQMFYFIDKCLPFGASISCANFQAFSDAIKHIVEWKISLVLYVKVPCITNYLDNFLFIAISLIICNGMIEIFMEICVQIGCPISLEKTKWALQLLIFLGILMNGRALTLCIPEDKRQKAMSLVNFAIDQKKVKVEFIQKLTGVLNFLNRAIVPGRAFTRGMYSRLKLTNKAGKPLKQYHHVYLNRQFILDCKMWRTFLVDERNKRLYQPFVDLAAEGDQNLQILKFYSDASKNEDFGMGAVFDERR